MNLSRQGHNFPGWIGHGLAWALLLALGLWLRVGSLETRPLHADEAVQGMIFAELLESGHYAYDPQHYHGPSLYYLTLPVAWARGQATAAELDEATLRLVPLLFSLLLAGAPLLFARELGRSGQFVACGCLLLAPGFVYYANYYVQEMLLVAGLAWFAGCWWRYLSDPAWKWAAGAGLAAGLMLASKENAVLLLGLVLLSGWLSCGTGTLRPRLELSRPALLHLAVALGATLLVVLPLFSSFGANPRGLLDAVRALYAYQPVPGHEKPWFYYLWLLGGGGRAALKLPGEAALLLAGLPACLLVLRPALDAPAARCARFHLLIGGTLLVLLSSIPYKTPWMILGILLPLAMLAGCGAAVAWKRLNRPWWRAVLALATALIGAALVREAVWATRTFPVDSRNPYAYVHTGWDLVELANRIRAVVVGSPEVVVKVAAAEYWPLPWYLRGLDRVGYWPALPEDPYAPVMVVSAELAGDLDPARMEAYVGDIRGLRPGKLLLLYIRRDLWERHILKPE